MITNRILLLALSVALLGLQAGCGDPLKNAFSQHYKANIHRLAGLYQMYQMTNDGIGPDGEEAFREYVASVPEDFLDKIGANPEKRDQLFVSERDKKPFHIVYSVEANYRQPAPIVFEQEGKDGKRWIGFTAGSCQEFSTEDYEKFRDGTKQIKIEAEQAR